MNKTVVITGGAKGIGKAIALAFAKRGFKIIINTRKNKEKLEETLTEIKNYSPSSWGIVCDVSDFEQAKAFFDQAGDVDILVNNAGISYIGLFNTMLPKDWQNVMSNNVNTVFNCTNLALQSMIKKHSGHIINISSMWGISGASCEAVYSASKGAVNAFTKAIAKEVAPSGIYVNAIACGAIETNMNSFLSPEEHEEFAQEIPMGRFGLPDEVAGLALYLAEENTYITGQIISLDGGMM